MNWRPYIFISAVLLLLVFYAHILNVDLLTLFDPVAWAVIGACVSLIAVLLFPDEKKREA